MIDYAKIGTAIDRCGVDYLTVEQVLSCCIEAGCSREEAEFFLAEFQKACPDAIVRVPLSLGGDHPHACRIGG